MLRVITILILLLNSLSVYGNQIEEKNMQSIVDDYLEKVQKSFCSQNIDSAYHYLNLADSIAFETELWNTYMEIPLWRVHCAREAKELQFMEFYLHQGEERLLTNKHKVNEQTWDELWIDFQIRMGDYYQQTGWLSKSFKLYESLIGYLEQKDSLSPMLYTAYIVCYIHIGDIHKLNQNYEKSINSYSYCINYEKENAKKQNRKAVYQTTFARLADVYVQKKDYKQAVKNYKKTLAYYNELLQFNPEYRDAFRLYILPLYYGISKSYYSLNRTDSAFYYANLALEYPNLKKFQKAETYLLLADIVQTEKKRKFHFQNAIQLFSDVYKNKHFETATAYSKQGGFFTKINNLEAAKKSYQAALIQLVDNFNDTLFSKNPSFAQIKSNKKDVLNTLNKKAALQFKLYESSNDANLLLQTWNTCQLAIELLESIRIGNYSVEDKQTLLEDSYAIFELALQTANELGENYWESAFQILEKSKAFSLLENFQKTTANSIGGIPEGTIAKEKVLSYQIAELEKILYTDVLSEEKTISTQNRIFELKRALETLVATLEEQYPIYHQLKYDFSIVSIQKLQSFLKTQNQSIIEFFNGKNNIYKFTITSSRIHLEKIENTPNLQIAATTIKNDLYSKNDDVYIEKARSLYNVLLKPTYKDIKLTERLIIIPDGYLSHIPFDVLLTKDVQSSTIYKAYPYLLKEHSISLYYSATLLKRVYEKTNSSFTNNKLLAFAPNYRDKKIAIAPLLAKGRKEERGQLYPLKYTESEVLGINKLVASEVIRHNNATKSVFLEKMATYPYVHIASHALENDKNSDYSYIAFSNTLDTLDNTFKLYVRELYELLLSTKMIVLSACETGSGKAYLGEGVISIARGFIYAGAKSVITTLWSVNDKSTAILMQHFYTQLQNNLEKDKALQQAKLNYLNDADSFNAHPKYWAAFVPLGNMNAVDLPSPTDDCIILILAIFMMIIITGFVFYIYRK